MPEKGAAPPHARWPGEIHAKTESVSHTQPYLHTLHLSLSFFLTHPHTQAEGHSRMYTCTHTHAHTHPPRTRAGTRTYTRADARTCRQRQRGGWGVRQMLMHVLQSIAITQRTCYETSNNFASNVKMLQVHPTSIDQSKAEEAAHLLKLGHRHDCRSAVLATSRGPIPPRSRGTAVPSPAGYMDRQRHILRKGSLPHRAPRALPRTLHRVALGEW
jgi:hypothetical protein